MAQILLVSEHISCIFYITRSTNETSTQIMHHGRSGKEYLLRNPGETCRNYPTSEFKSFTECDDQYVKRRINQLASGLNLTPVWMTNKLDLVTTQPLPTNRNVLGNELLQVFDTFLLSAKLGNLFFGVDPSDCPLPCKTFSTEVKYFYQSDEHLGISLSFLSTVEVVNFILFCV